MLKQWLKKQSVDSKFETLRFSVAIIIALLVAFGLILLVSKEPFEALRHLFLGPISKFRKIGNVVETAIPLTFLGLSVSVMFSANQFNMGSSGALFMGGTVAAIVGLTLPLPTGIHPFVALMFVGVVGGLITSIPAIIKLKWNASELVSSLMLNFVALNLGLYLIMNHFRDPDAGTLASFKFPETALLPTLIKGTRIHFGIFIVILMVILIWLFLAKTKWGYALRMTGMNMNFAKYSGISTAAVILYSQFIGGFLAGMGGAVEVLGMYDRFRWQMMPTYAFDGVIVAVLGKRNPIFVPVAAILLAYIRVGADTMSVNSDVSYEMISIIQGFIIIMIAANAFLKHYRQKMVVKEATSHD